MPFEEFKEKPLIEEEKKLKEKGSEKVEEGPKVEERPKEEPEEEKLKTIQEIQDKIRKIGEKKSREEEEVKQKRKREVIIREVIEKTIPEIFRELIGDDSEKAWKERKKEEKEHPKEIIASLAFVASEKSREYIKERLGKGDKQKFWWAISRGLIGDASPEADEIRDWLKFDSEVGRLRAGINAKLIKFLGLHKSERWYNFRRKIDKWFPLGLYLPGDLLISTTGIKSDKKYELIKELEELCPAEALLCLIGDDSPEAKQIREKYKGDKKLRWAYEKSSIGVEM
jgi:hypothetical protein